MRVEAEKKVAEQNAELAVQQADMTVRSETKRAEADAAYSIQQENQRKTIEVTKVNADIAKKEKDLTFLRKQLAQSGNVLQQVQQSLERVQLSAVLPPSTTPFLPLEAPKADKPQTDDSLPDLENRLDRLFSDTLNNLNNGEKTAQNTMFHLVKSIS